MLITPAAAAAAEVWGCGWVVGWVLTIQGHHRIAYEVFFFFFVFPWL